MIDTLTEVHRSRITAWEPLEFEDSVNGLGYTVDAATVAELKVGKDEISVRLTPYGSGDLTGMDLTPTNDDAFTSVAAARRAVECALTAMQY